MPPITLKKYLTEFPVKEGYEESDGSPVMGDAKETVSEAANEPARTGSDFPAKKKTGTYSQQTATMKTHLLWLQNHSRKRQIFSQHYSARIWIDCMSAYWTAAASG
jgi:hypothetical protein